MAADRNTSAEIARSYFGADTALTCLGWGVSGFVYLSPDGRAVVKIYRHEEAFTREVEVYRRLRRLRITELHGLTIPKLLDARRDLMLISMDFVIAPYLLDFAGVRFDPPDYPPDVMEHWHAQIARMYGPNAGIAYAVYHTLSQHGMYYMDFRPSNMNLTGLPGLEPFDPSEDDNDS